MISEKDNPVKQCWNEVGVYGSASCPELASCGHCRRCPVYASAGRDLLDRPIPEGLLEERAALMAQGKEAECARPISVMVFRIEGEFLALETQYFEQVAETTAVHRFPLRSNRVFRGIVNIDGELHLCFSLAGLLDLPPWDGADSAGPKTMARMMIIRKDGGRFVFPVHEMCGVHRISSDEIRNPPATVSKGVTNLTRGLFYLDDVHVGLLKEEDLFEALSRCVIS